MNTFFKFEKMMIFHASPVGNRHIDEEVTENFSFREITTKELKEHEVFQVKNRYTRYLNHLKNGHRIFGYFTKNDNSLACYIWLGFQPDDNDFPKDWAYVWDCRTIEKFQGKKLYRNALKETLEFCQKSNIKNVTISCNVDNTASRKGIEASGFCHVSTVNQIKFPRYTWIFKKLFRSKFISNGKNIFLF